MGLDGVAVVIHVCAWGAGGVDARARSRGAHVTLDGQDTHDMDASTPYYVCSSRVRSELCAPIFNARGACRAENTTHARACTFLCPFAYVRGMGLDVWRRGAVQAR